MKSVLYQTYIYLLSMSLNSLTEMFCSYAYLDM